MRRLQALMMFVSLHHYYSLIVVLITQENRLHSFILHPFQIKCYFYGKSRKWSRED